jgi:drug/metabolite transporter (DMT)-like permease
MDRGRAVGLTLVVVSAVGFSSSTLLAKPAYALGVNWLQLLAWRFTFAATLSWVWLAISPSRRDAVRQLDRRQTLAALGLGLWYTASTSTYYVGLQTVPASLAGIIVYLYPAIVAILSLRYATRFSGRRPWVALVIAVVGGILTVGGIDTAAAPPLLSIAFTVVSPVIYAGWIILSARLAGERSDRLAIDRSGDGHVDDASAATTLMITATAVVLMTAAFASGQPIEPSRIPPAAWPYIAFIAFAATFVAIQMFYAGSRRIGAAQAALVSTVEPLTIVLLAVVLLHETLAPIQLVGAALVLIGVILAQTSGGQRAPGEPQPATPLEAAVQPEG